MPRYGGASLLLLMFATPAWAQAPIMISDGTDIANVSASGGLQVQGEKGDNAVVPGTSNIGVLIGVANAVAPTRTEGFQVGASFDLTGALRTTGGAGGGDASAANQTTQITSLQLLDNAISGAGFNITQLAGAATPMTTTQADNLADSLDGLNGTVFAYVYDGAAWDRLRGDSTLGVTTNTEMSAAAAASDAFANPTTGGVLSFTMVYDSVAGTWKRAQPISDPCDGSAKIPFIINQTTNTQLFTGTASNRTFFCSIHITSAGALNVALVSGTGSVCATSVGPIFGGTTAATGWHLDSGISLGNGSAMIGKSDTDADNICLLQSTSDHLSGGGTYVVAAN